MLSIIRNWLLQKIAGKKVVIINARFDGVKGIIHSGEDNVYIKNVTVTNTNVGLTFEA